MIFVGLDYALLQKVRSEISQKEKEQEDELERLANKSIEEKEKRDIQKKDIEEIQFKTKIGRAIHHTIASLKSRHIERSELFLPGRMAYVIDLGQYNISHKSLKLQNSLLSYLSLLNNGCRSPIDF